MMLSLMCKHDIEVIHRLVWFSFVKITPKAWTFSYPRTDRPERQRCLDLPCAMVALVLSNMPENWVTGWVASIREDLVTSIREAVVTAMGHVPPLHYRLRPIKRGQFRFSNFASHFISVQIFQINFSTLPPILSVSKYFRYVLRTRNEHFFFFY